jgi:peptide/nickel transport system ATP-binding protein
VAVMHAGQVVECAAVVALFGAPAHPYTRALVRSIPRIDREVKPEPIPGAMPSLIEPPPGCRYAGRCPLVMEACRRKPATSALAPDHRVACWAAEERHGAAA